MTPTQKGVAFVALGAILFSAKAIFIKLAYTHYNINDITLLTLRFGFSLPFFLAIAFWNFKKGNMQSIVRKDVGYIAILAMLGYYIASWFDFKGLQYIPAGIERIILFIYPTFVVLFSRILLKKSISKIGILALAITYLGIIIIAFDPHLFQSKNVVEGAMYILISAITYALYLTYGGEIVQKYGSVNFNSIAMIFSSVYVIIHFLVFEETNITMLENGVYAYGFLLAIVSTVIPTFLVMEGIQILGANRASIVASLGPVSTIVLGYYILNENFTLQELFGSLFILGGVLLIGKSKS